MSKSALFLFLLLMVISGRAWGDVPAIFAFGDSYSDVGNSNAAGATKLGPPVYALGEATDGAGTIPPTKIEGIWIQSFAKLLKLPVPEPSSSGGGDFAFYGAETGPDHGPYLGMQTQVAQFLKLYPAAPPRSIYVLWGGINDLPRDIPAATAGPFLLGNEALAVGQIKAEIGQLAAAGAKTFVWVNVPPLDKTPEGLASGNEAALFAACAQFSADIDTSSAALEATYPGITISKVDVFTLINDIVTHQDAYDFSNVTSPSQGHATVDPDRYLFWDILHPTTAGHDFISQKAYGDFTTQTITFPALGPVVYGQTLTLTARSSSGLPVGYRLRAGAATISGNSITFDHVTKVVLAAIQPGLGEIFAAKEVTQTIVVAKASQTLTPFPVIADRVFSPTPFTIALPVASSGLAVKVTVKEGPATISGARLKLTGPGVVTLSASQPGNADYLPARPVATSFVVKP